MKKYESNKAKKMLLATLIIPVAVSSITPIALQSEEVHANSINDVPILRVYDHNGSPKLEWATEILKENIIIQTGFEPGQMQPFLDWDSNKYNYLHSVSAQNPYSGNYNYLLNDNSGGKGNHYAYPETSSNNTIFTLDRMYGLPNGIPLSLTFKAKTDGVSTIRPSGDGNWADSFITYDNKITKNSPAGSNTIYLDNVDNFYLGQWVTDDVTVSNPQGMYLITGINKSNNSIEINWPLIKGVNANTNLKSRPYRGVFSFDWRTIDNKNWETYSINTMVNSYDDYDIAKRGFTFYMTNSTDSKLQIDDITFGYATEVEVYREGKSIYKGYLSDFHDTSIKDNVKPNKVSKVNGSVSNDFKVNLSITKPSDNGINTSYQIQSISKNGNRSALSSPTEVEIKTDVVKYKYVINNQINGTPNKEISTLDNISLPLNSINMESDYLHIQSIDKNGNISDVQSFKMSDIVNVSSLVTLQDAYDRIAELEQSQNFHDFIDFTKELESTFGGQIPKDLQNRVDSLKEKNLNNLLDKLTGVENSNDYYEFIDFMDEVESLLGVNLPEELFNRIEELAKHHGVNTSFLLLEEGDFRITTSDINDFGQVKLTAKKQTVTTDFVNNFSVIDARGTQQGWNMTVSATPFTVETFEGFVGTPYQLPLGSLALNAPINIEQVGKVHNSQPPTITMNQLSVLDGSNHTVQLLNADQHKGMGEFNFSFGTDALVLTVDAVTAKIDNVNYPDQNTPYVSTVTWDLISGPKS